MAIMGLVSVLAFSMFSSIRGAGDLTKTANDIAGMLEQARAYALAQNTYVWVGFKNEGSQTLLVGVVASKTGLPDPDSDIVPIGKLARFENVEIVHLPDSASRPTLGVDQLTNSSFSFSVGTNQFSSKVVQWNSQGEAKMNSAHLSKFLEIAFQASAGGIKRNPANYAAIQIGGLSGAIEVYRP